MSEMKRETRLQRLARRLAIKNRADAWACGFLMGALGMAVALILLMRV